MKNRQDGVSLTPRFNEVGQDRHLSLTPRFNEVGQDRYLSLTPRFNEVGQAGEGAIASLLPPR